MLIKTLAENTSLSKELGSEHGLSLYIEANHKKLLFDVGLGELFYQNAKKMGVDISQVDFLVISHGHSDHGGGITTFLEHNAKAKVFLHRDAFVGHYSLRRKGNPVDIGLLSELIHSERIVQVEEGFQISEEFLLFSDVETKYRTPSSNQFLFMEEAGKMKPDTFSHEQNLVIREGSKKVLITGCAHNGILNIIEAFHQRYGSMPDYVIGGFHLCNPATGEPESDEILEEVADYFIKSGAKFYTGHCTGLKSYEILKQRMGDRIEYLSGGSQFIL